MAEQTTDPATVARFAAWLREREHLATPGLRDTAELLEAQAAEIARLQAALAEALPFLPDARNAKAPAVVAWHTAHAETIRAAAAATGRERLL